jgi:hypothetical protein
MDSLDRKIIRRRDRQRRSASERQRRYRARQRLGQAVYLVELDHRVLSLLICCGYLADAEATDSRKVTRALSEMLRDASTSDDTRPWHARRHEPKDPFKT